MGANTCSKSTVKKLKQRIRCCIVFIANFARRDSYCERPKKIAAFKICKISRKTLMTESTFSKLFFLGIFQNPQKGCTTFLVGIRTKLQLPTNCISVFDHFVELALKGLIQLRET